MAHDSEQKIKLLVLYDILCRLTDEDHALNTDEIIEASRRVILKCGFTFDHYGQYSRFDGSETFDASFYVMHLD